MRKPLVLLAALIIVGSAFPASAANTLEVTAGAALFGTNFGLAVTSDLSSNDVYVSDTSPNNEALYRFSFRIFPGTMTAPSNVQGGYLIGFVETTTGSECGSTCKPWSIPIYLRRQNQYWTIQTNTRNNNNSFPTWENATKICGDPSTTIPCSSFAYGVKIEIEYKAASAPGANDGYMTVKRNGVLQRTFSNLDNDERLVKSIRWGAIFQGTFNNTPAPEGSGGTYYFDEFESYRTAAP